MLFENHYNNFHFTEDVSENDIIFPYVLKPGRAESRNAIKLLGLMGYGDSITDAAREASEKFIQYNKWSKI